MRTEQNIEVTQNGLLKQFIKIHENRQVHQYKYSINEKRIINRSIIDFKQLAFFKSQLPRTQQNSEQKSDAHSTDHLTWFGPISLENRFLQIFWKKINYDKSNLITYFQRHHEYFNPFAFISLKNIQYVGLCHSPLGLPLIIYNLGPSAIKINFIEDQRDIFKLLNIIGYQDIKMIQETPIFIDEDYLKKYEIKMKQFLILPNDYLSIELYSIYWQEPNDESIAIISNILYDRNEDFIIKCFMQNKKYRQIELKDFKLPLLRIYIDIYIHINDYDIRKQFKELFQDIVEEQNSILDKISQIGMVQRKNKQMFTRKTVDMRNQFHCSFCYNEIYFYFYNERYEEYMFCLDCLYKHDINKQQVRKTIEIKILYDFDFKNIAEYKCQFNCNNINDCEQLNKIIQFQTQEKRTIEEENLLSIRKENVITRNQIKQFVQIKKNIRRFRNGLKNE